MAEPAVAAVGLTRCGGVAEAEILHSDGTDVGSSSKTNDPADRVTKLCVPAKAGPGEVERNPGGPACWVTPCVHDPASEMIGVEVNRDDSVGHGVLQGYRRNWCAGP
jgi:hypothetical protein